MKPKLIVALVAPLLLASDLAPSGRLPEPEYLPELARQLLKKKMRRHGADMTQLFLSTTLLQREKTRILASEISKEVRLSRPTIGGEDELNTALPEKFFVLQDEVRSRARNLAEATRSADDAELAKSFGLLMQTCVECHSAFLKKE
jgi:cytochrome c556